VGFGARSRDIHVGVADSAERKAQNEARFREANELQRTEAAAIVEDREEFVPFLCECPDVRCTAVVLVTLREYEDVRSRATDGLAVPGHEDLAIEHVIASTDRFLRTRKTGVAGQKFAELDPRT
jgi:hypothetical protein